MSDEIVISGISGRFPECDSLDEFIQKLYGSESPITYDERKWPKNYRYKFGKDDIPYGTGKFKNIEHYDNIVFAISPVLANQIDIINRMVLEPSFEAVFDAGINPYSLMGANVGCYITSGISEVENIKITTNVERLSLIGGSKGMLSNRVSFALNLTGPSITFYTAAYGGLEALTHAYENLITKRIDGAIVGSSASHVDPKVSINYQLMGYLSPDGVTKSFDADANGFGRSDCVVMLYLQRASDAKRSYGSLLFTETVYRGLSLKSFLGYDETFIEETLRAMYAKHKDIDPNDISYMEMDANAVKHIDRREALAVSNIFCTKRDGALLIGSVKSHSGHTETSAGYLSIVKACLALDKGVIAPNMHYSKPNPDILPLVEGKMKVVTEEVELPGTMVGVTSFTLTGSVSHAVFKQNQKKQVPDDNLPRLILLCGRMKEDLMGVIKKIESEPLNKEFVAITNDIFKTPLPSHIYRGYTVLSPSGATNHSDVEIIEGENRPVWFAFSGMGSQWNGMGKDLLTIPVFSDVIDECDRILRPKGIDIRYILTTDEPTIFDDIINAFVGIVAVQIGLVKVMDTIGIKADGLIGHSLGETACAYADGSLTLEQAVLASYERGAVSNETEMIKGMMAAIGMGHKEVQDMLPDEIQVACHNASDNCTISGPAESVTEFVAKLQKQNVFAKSVNVSNRAYHSRYVHPAAPLLLSRLQEIIPEPKERTSKWISTSVAEADWAGPLAKTSSAAYFTNNFINPVLFEEGCKHIPENAIVLEIAPHGLLQAILKRSLAPTITKLSLTLRSERAGGVQFLLSTVGKLFIAGCQPDINELYPKIEYPVSRGTPNTASIATWDHSRKWDVPGILTDSPLSEEEFKVKLSRGYDYMFLKAHQIKDHYIIPPSFYMYITWFILSLLRREELGASNIIFEDIRIRKHLHVTIDKPRSLSVMIQGSGSFEVRLESEEENSDVTKTVMTGIIYVPYDKLKLVFDKNCASKMKYKINGEDFYKILENAGYKLEDSFTNLVKEVEFNEKECAGKMIWGGNWICFLDTIMKLNMYSSQASYGELLLPRRIRRLAIDVSTFNQLKTGDELIFTKDLIVDKFCCDGLELFNFTCGPEDLRILRDNREKVVIQGRHFVSHSNPNTKNMNTFLNVCLQLVFDNITCGTKSKLRVIDTMSNSAKVLRDIVDEDYSMKSKTIFSDIQELTSGTYSQDDTYFLLVNSFCSLNKLHNQLKNKLDNLFVLVTNSVTDNDTLRNKNSFVEIIHQTFNETNVQLFKKVCAPNSPLPPIMIADEHWPVKLAPVLRSKASQPVVLLRYGVESTDLLFMLSEQKLFPNVRCLFIMDEQPPKFSVENPFYKNQILQDLPVSVLKNGQWGSYRSLESVEDDSSRLNLPMTKYNDFCFSNINVKYFNLELVIDTDYCTGLKEYLCALEFSGSTKSKERIMGLGYYDPRKQENRQGSEDLLVWHIPSNWSFEDAATVPLIYLQVYYILMVKWIKKRTCEHLLINSDNMSLIEAIIIVSQHYKIKPYIVVSNSDDANLLLKKFPHLTRSQILDRDECKYEIQIKTITKGEGVNMVINCITDQENIVAIANSVQGSGMLVDLSDKRYEEEQFGMYSFLKSIAFVTAPHDLISFLRLPSEEKELLHGIIERDIKAGVIKPLPRTITKYKYMEYNERCKRSTANVKEIHPCYEKDIPVEKYMKPLKWDANRSYIIISSGKKTKFWFELLEWLVSKGIRKFLIALDNFTLDQKISHEVNRIIVQNNATIVMTTSKKAETIEDASELITEANNIAPLEAVFFVSLESAGSYMANLDIASRNKAPCHFVSLFSGAFRECEHRRQRGRPTTLVHAEKHPERLQPVLEKLVHIFEEPQTELSPSLFEIKEKIMSKRKIPAKLDVRDFISINVKDLINIGYYATEQPQFKEILTRSQKLSEVKNLRPLFLIPAIDINFVKPLASKLAYPTFCATFTEQVESPTRIAEKLFKNLNEIEPTGPVTIIGETWNSPIALELALLVQEAGRKVELFLIEGDPVTWKECIESLSNISGGTFDDNYLQTILPKNKFDHVSTKQNNPVGLSWEENRDNRLRSMKFSQDEREYITKALNGIRNRLITVANYPPSKKFLKHAVLFKHRPSARSLDQYCWSDDVYLFKVDDYKTFLNNQEMLRIIHFDTLFSWFV